MKVEIRSRLDFFMDMIIEGLTARYAIIWISIGEMSAGEPQENINCR